jgi:hypothetical protein
VARPRRAPGLESPGEKKIEKNVFFGTVGGTEIFLYKTLV